MMNNAQDNVLNLTSKEETVMNNMTQDKKENILKGELSMTTMTITNQAQLLNYRGVINSKPQIATLFLSGANLFVQEMAWSPIMKYANYTEAMVPGHSGVMTNYDSLNKVKFQETFIKAVRLNKKTARVLIKFGFKRTNTDQGTTILGPVMNAVGQITGWRNKTKGLFFSTVTPEEQVKFDAFCIANNVMTYSAFAASPSDVRTLSLWFMDVTNGDKRSELANELTGGAYNLIKDNFMNRTELANVMARIGLWMAPSRNVGTIPGILLINEKIRNYVTGEDTWDGGTMMSADYGAEVYSDVLTTDLGTSITVEPEAVVGLHTQDRINNINVKGSTRAYSKASFNLIAKNLMANYEYQILGDANNVVWITDMNGAKLIGDTTREFNWFLLDMFKSTPAKLSQQFFQKMGSIDVEETVDLYDDTMIRPEMDSLFGDKQEVPTPEEAQNESGYMIDNLSKINKGMLKNDPAMMTAKSRTSIQRWTRTAYKLNMDVQGFNTKLWFAEDQLFLSNPEEALNGATSIIAYGEGFNKAVWNVVKVKIAMAKTPEEKELARICVMIKYPAMGMKEVYVFKCVSPNEIKSRVRNMNCSNEEKEAVLESYLRATEATLILPAHDELKIQCAGSDIDGDGGTVITDSRIVNKFLNYEVEVVEIGNGASVSKKESSRYGHYKKIVEASNDIKISNGNASVDNLMNISYAGMILGDNLGVGTITRKNDLVVLLYIALRSGDKTSSIALMKEMGASELGGKYVSPLRRDAHKVFVTLADQVKIVSAISNMDCNDVANIKLALEDLNIAHRMLQEMTIDSAKKGNDVPYKFNFGNFNATCFLGLQNNAPAFLRSLKHNRLGFAIERQYPQTDKEITYVADVFSKIQDKVVERIIEATEVIGDSIEIASLTTAELAYLTNLYDSYDQSYDIDEIVKKLYRACATTYSKSIVNIDEETYEELWKADEADKDEASREFDEEIAVLDNFTRWITQDIEDLATIGSIIKACSISRGRSQELDGSRSNQMPYSLFFEAALARIIAKEGSMKQCGYKLLIAKDCEIGEVIEFKGGVGMNKANKTMFLKNSIYTGALTIQEIDGSLYAAKDIEIERKPVDKSHIVVNFRAAIDITKKGVNKVAWETVQADLNKATEIKLLPQFVQNGHPVKDAILATIDGVTKVIGRYSCESSILEKIYDGMTGSIRKVYFKEVDGFKSLFIDMNVTGQEATGKTNFGSSKKAKPERASAVDDSNVPNVDSAVGEASDDL
jgi:hypothetical protein